MQAIRTRYHGPTNTRGSRIVAKCEAGTFSMPYDYSLTAAQNHATCAARFIAKLGWDWVYVGGVFDNDWYWSAVCDNAVDHAAVDATERAA